MEFDILFGVLVFFGLIIGIILTIGYFIGEVSLLVTVAYWLAVLGCVIIIIIANSDYANKKLLGIK